MAESHSTPPLRPCPKCRQTFPLTPEFWHRNAKSPYGFRSRCKPCNQAYDRAYKAHKPPPRFPQQTERRCTQCGQTFPLTPDHWHRDRDDRWGFRRWCKACALAADRIYKAKQPKRPKPTTRRCPRCKQTLPLTREHWGRNNAYLHGWSTYCKPCTRAKTAAYRAKQPRTTRPIHPRRPSFRAQCRHCGKTFLGIPARVERNQGLFCSKRCFFLYRGPSSLEILARETLDALRAPYLEQFRIGIYVADFLLYFTYVLEVDGNYWHDNKARDRRKDAYLRKRGYTVFRIDEDTLRANPTRAIRAVLRQIPL